jgi:Fe-S oxidoreductase
MERCNFNVRFTDFIRSLRYRAVNEGHQVDLSHGGTPQSMMHIMGQKDTRQDRLSWLTDDIKVARRSDTAFFIGCTPYFNALFTDLDLNIIEGSLGALRLLNRARIPFSLLPDERCCGRDLLLVGDGDGFMDLAGANQKEFSRRGIKRIITNCPECYHTHKVDYPAFLDNWSIEVRHMTEIIAPIINTGSADVVKTGIKVTYHDPCILGRYSRIFDQPRRILDSTDGLEMVEMADNREKSLCCGASPWAHCGSVNKQVQKERLAQAAATGAELLVTACPKCQIHLKCAQKNAEDGDVCQIEIRDIFDVTAEILPFREVG